jgi:hypothetical protein
MRGAARAAVRVVARIVKATALTATALTLPLVLTSCGGQDMQIGVAASPPPSQNDEWPQLVANSPPDAVGVTSALECADGARVRVRAYLVAIAAPCPACNVGARSKREDLPGRTSKPTAINPTGCLPCPDPVATISDEVPTASGGPKSPPLRAVGVASGLQPRHVGHLFLLTGTFHARLENGPELDVTDVRALDAQ